MNNNTTTATTSPYAPNAMRSLIIQKSMDGQRRAISLGQVEEAGFTKSTFDQWVYNVDCLYEAALDYSKSLTTIDEGPCREELYARWRTILKTGEEDVLHPNLFVRRHDVENLRVLAAESDELYVDGIGFVPTVKGKLAFRAKLEIRLACRIAANAVLGDEDRQTLLDMRRAERQIDSANKVLNGYTEGKNVVSSISARIKDAEEELKNTEETLEKAGVKDVLKYTKRLVGEINTLKEQQTAAQKRLKKWTKVKTDLQEKYDGIISSLDSIECA